MKKVIIILTVLFCAANAYSQEATESNPPAEKPKADYAQHRLHIYGGASYTNSIFNRMRTVDDVFSMSGIAEMKYAFFFKKNWGVSLGLGVSYYGARGTLNMKSSIESYLDAEYDQPNGLDTYTLYYETDDLLEKQRILALEVPLQFHFEHKVNRATGIFASLGATGYFPVLAQSRFPQGNGTLTTRGYDHELNCWWENIRQFGTREVSVVPAKAKMRPSVDLVAEFGGIFRLSEIADFYLGIFGSYGFLDILPKAENKLEFITPGIDRYVVNSMLASNALADYNLKIDDNLALPIGQQNSQMEGWEKVSEKWNRWQAGVKIGFHIKPLGKKARQEKRLRDAQKEFYEDASDYMKKRGNEPKVEYHTVYIYNIAPEGYMDDKDLSEKDKENISDLANVLSSGKILFDLDSDVPKIKDRKFIYDACEILKRDPSLALIIEGYTCDLGSEAHNRDLAQRRAAAIRNLFIQQGVSSSQITDASYTVSDPQNRENIDSKQREEHRAVIFRIVKKR